MAKWIMTYWYYTITKKIVKGGSKNSGYEHALKKSQAAWVQIPFPSFVNYVVLANYLVSNLHILQLGELNCMIYVNHLTQYLAHSKLSKMLTTRLRQKYTIECNLKKYICEIISVLWLSVCKNYVYTDNKEQEATWKVYWFVMVEW